MLKIEKGIPAPKVKEHHGKWLGTLRQMKIGDSFALPIHLMFTLRYSVSQAKKRGALDGDFIVRPQGDSTARCWRIKKDH